MLVRPTTGCRWKSSESPSGCSLPLETHEADQVVFHCIFFFFFFSFFISMFYIVYFIFLCFIFQFFLSCLSFNYVSYVVLLMRIWMNTLYYYIPWINELTCDLQKDIKFSIIALSTLRSFYIASKIWSCRFDFGLHIKWFLINDNWIKLP